MSRNYCLDGIDDGALEEEFAALEEEIALEQMDSKSTKKMLDEFSTISVTSHIKKLLEQQTQDPEMSGSELDDVRCTLDINR